jgi:glucose-6-phosphate 1-dehydrogenase
MRPYERLLGDALAGDRTLFGSQAGVEASWAIVEPVLNEPTPPHPYRAGSWGPREADRIGDALGGWRVSSHVEVSVDAVGTAASDTG